MGYIVAQTEVGKPSRISRYIYLFKKDISETKYLDTQRSKILEYLRYQSI